METAVIANPVNTVRISTSSVSTASTLENGTYYIEPQNDHPQPVLSQNERFGLRCIAACSTIAIILWGSVLWVAFLKA